MSQQHAFGPVQGSSNSKVAVLALIRDRVLYCVRHHRSLDVAASLHEEVALLSSLVTGASTADAAAWQSQILLTFQLLLSATGVLLPPVTANHANFWQR